MIYNCTEITMPTTFLNPRCFTATKQNRSCAGYLSLLIDFHNTICEGIRHRRRLKKVEHNREIKDNLLLTRNPLAHPNGSFA